MPSRAVLKKIARREAKRSKASVSDDALIKFKREREATPIHEDHPPVASSSSPQQNETEEPAYETVIVKRRRVDPLITAPSNPIAAVEDNAEPPAAPKTHKERKKLEAKRKLERQMHRVAAESARAVASAKTVEDASSGVATPSAPAANALRHDPKFAQGTFWRDRKDKKKRTLFVGNLPSTSSAATIKTLIDAIVVNTAAAQLDSTLEGEGAAVAATSVVESVEVLPKKYGSRVLHAYVTFRTVDDSARAQTYLNGMEMGGNFLRVNCAADKQQRAVAIEKRNGLGQQGLRGGRGFGRGRGQGRGRGW